MKLVSEVLAEKKLTVSQLPQELKDEVESLKGLIVKYNETCDEYDEEEEKNETTETSLNEMEAYIANTEKGLAEKIKALVVTEPAPNPAPAPAAPKVVEEKKSSFGWAVFGVAALVLTVGAVNVFRKK